MSKFSIILLFVCVGLFIFSFFIKEEETSQLNQQPLIDSLTEVINKKDIEHKLLIDSLDTDTETREKSIDLINQIKKTIKNEIAKNKQTIFSVPDSTFQHYVDSIRTNKGFY